VGDGSKMLVEAGGIILSEDLTGRGHITRELGDPQVNLLLPLGDTDLSRWLEAGS
jgi:hypothetical protein